MVRVPPPPKAWLFFIENCFFPSGSGGFILPPLSGSTLCALMCFLRKLQNSWNWSHKKYVFRVLLLNFNFFCTNLKEMRQRIYIDPFGDLSFMKFCAAPTFLVKLHLGDVVEVLLVVGSKNFQTCRYIPQDRKIHCKNKSYCFLNGGDI